MRADSRVVLDACVLIPMPLADTLLRMAETPRFYLPKWSQMIMDEVTRNLIQKWNMPPEKAHRREDQLRRYFPEAWVDGFEPLIGAISNHPKDRHVIAAAVLLEPISSSPTTVGISQLSPCRHGRSKSRGHPRSCAASMTLIPACSWASCRNRLLQSAHH